MRQILAVLALALLSACSGDAPTAARTPSTPNLAVYNASAPKPVLLSAVDLGTLPGTSIATVQVTFTDIAEGERIVSAYCTSSTAPAATQNIEGTADASGDRTVDILLPDTCETLRLRYMWGTLPGDGSDIVWGPFSGAVAITDGSVVTTTSAKGKKK